MLRVAQFDLYQQASQAIAEDLCEAAVLEFSSTEDLDPKYGGEFLSVSNYNGPFCHVLIAPSLLIELISCKSGQFHLLTVLGEKFHMFLVAGEYTDVYFAFERVGMCINLGYLG